MDGVTQSTTDRATICSGMSHNDLLTTCDSSRNTRKRLDIISEKVNIFGRPRRAKDACLRQQRAIVLTRSVQNLNKNFLDSGT